MSRHRDLRADGGMTLIETLITIVVLTTGVLVTLGVFSQMSRTTYVAQRKAVLISMAQREMERLRVLPYDRLGLSTSLPADAPARCRAACPPETLVSGGLVAPGPEPFSVQGVTGKLYRFVTWRPQPCAPLNATVATQLSTELGHTRASVESAVGDLCQGSRQTKRITIVVTSNDVVEFGGPVRLSTVAADPSSSVLAAGNYDGLRVDAAPVANQVTGAQPPSPATVYAAVTSQAFNLTDTACTEPARRPPGGGHPSHDTSRDGDAAAAGAQPPACGGADGPDLMSADPIVGSVADPLPDLSQEVSRQAVGGRVLARDDRGDGCEQERAYAAEDAVRRKRSVHTWATKAPAAGWETPDAAGRATLTFWTQVASAQQMPGRLCVTLWRAGTGEVLGSADHQLPAWPASPTQLAVAFDLAHAAVPAGERLMVTLRTPADSGADLLLLYDHPGYQTSLSLTTKLGKEIR